MFKNHIDYEIISIQINIDSSIMQTGQNIILDFF